jgi:hypothetical protein
MAGRFRKRVAMVINPRCPTLTLACPCQYDAGGRSISHAESIPIHLFAIKSSRVRRPRCAYLWFWAEWALAHHVRQLARCPPCITIKCWSPGAEFKRFCVVAPPLWLLISRPLTIGLERPYCLFLRTVHLSLSTSFYLASLVLLLLLVLIWHVRTASFPLFFLVYRMQLSMCCPVLFRPLKRRIKINIQITASKGRSCVYLH